MWPFGRRTKKLIVAFHFQFSNQAGWRCDTCRKSGLAMKRRCGWLPVNVDKTPSVPVWVRGRVGSTECPKSYVTSESLALLEQFYAWKLLGSIDPKTLPARTMDAFF